MTKVVNELVDSVGVEEIMPSDSRPPSSSGTSAEAHQVPSLLCAGSGVHGTRAALSRLQTRPTLWGPAGQSGTGSAGLDGSPMWGKAVEGGRFAGTPAGGGGTRPEVVRPAGWGAAGRQG